MTGAEELCGGCAGKALSCRVCGHEFQYADILAQLPITQCPTCEGRAIDVSE
jgi:predicted Zn-ribbon and HTH transcriptional regulator